ncbi:MAG: RsmE family RNA methyltransferase [Fimbriimonas sp.]
MSDLRSLPRVFVPGADPSGSILLPSEELHKLRKVLRLADGAELAILPDDGSVIRARLDDRSALPFEVTFPATEATVELTIAQALPKADKLDEIIRACTEIGAARFVLFPAHRSVVQWDAKKTADRIARLATIAREACEVAFRTRVPTFEVARDLAEVLVRFPEAQVLSEVAGVPTPLPRPRAQETIVVGPEGGWDQREVQLIGSRAVTLGPRVLRVDHAAPAAAAILLLDHAF